MSPLPGANRMEQLVESIAERVVNLVLDAIDINAIVAQVDMDAVLSKVDVDSIVSKVDVDGLIDRVDVQKIIERVDIDSLVQQTELGTIIAHSTSGIASEALDVVRAQGVGLDDFIARWVNRILRRSSADWPAGPEKLLEVPPAPVPSLPAEVSPS